MSHWPKTLPAAVIQGDDENYQLFACRVGWATLVFFDLECFAIDAFYRHMIRVGPRRVSERRYSEDILEPSSSIFDITKESQSEYIERLASEALQFIGWQGDDEDWERLCLFLTGIQQTQTAGQEHSRMSLAKLQRKQREERYEKAR